VLLLCVACIFYGWLAGCQSRMLAESNSSLIQKSCNAEKLQCRKAAMQVLIMILVQFQALYLRVIREKVDHSKKVSALTITP
jgi:hypothetical protein